jgi:phytoene dehydrogenase-like protein
MRVVIVGAGHNGLIAATFLARAGLHVTVLEGHTSVGGASRTEYPFPKAPAVGSSPGAYLLGVMPPELVATLGIELTLLRRNPHYFLPTRDRRFLLLGSDSDELKRQCIEFFSEDDWRASEALNLEIGQLRDDLAPSWLAEPLPAAETAERYVRPELRQAFLELVTKPVDEYIARFGFTSDLLVAMYAVTDGFSGLNAGFGMPGTGLNFLVHNMCRLSGSDGTWMVVKGGMGRVTAELARVAREAGARIETGTAVSRIRTSSGRVTGVVLESGQEIDAPVVVSNADPFRMRTLVGAQHLPPAFNVWLDSRMRTGTTMKVNFAMDGLPSFRCLQDDRGQHRGTIHLLPDGPDVLGQVKHAFNQAQAGELPDFPTIEWYIHTAIDPSLSDARGLHSGAFFVQWAPYTLKEGTWAERESSYVGHLFALADEFAPGFAASVVDVFALSPPGIERHFGMSYGHIHHIDNTFGFDERMPYATPIEGLYSCSAGCHPAGSVIGAAGHNAAQRILKDLR